MTQRFCVACRWHRKDPPHGDGLCDVTVLDVVTGQVLDAQAGLSCRLLRRPDMPCGPEGRLWEAKPVAGEYAPLRERIFGVSEAQDE